MSDSMGRVVFAVDFDGTLVQPDLEGVLQWVPGALEFLRGALARGIKIIIHSYRLTLSTDGAGVGDADYYWRTGLIASSFLLEGWASRQQLVETLQAAEILDQVSLWEAPGKPLADVYVDDRAEKPDWYVLAREFGVDLSNAARTG